MAQTVQCVPGGHQVPLDKNVYWCATCGFYICYKHLWHATLSTAVKCPKGHEVSKAK